MRTSAFDGVPFESTLFSLAMHAIDGGGVPPESGDPEVGRGAPRSVRAPHAESRKAATNCLMIGNGPCPIDPSGKYEQRGIDGLIALELAEGDLRLVPVVVDDGRLARSHHVGVEPERELLE